MGNFHLYPCHLFGGETESLTVGLAAVSDPATGSTLYAYLNGVLTGIAVYDANGNLDNSFKINAASGIVYSPNGCYLYLNLRPTFCC